MQNRIRELREAQGLTQDDLAKRLEVTRQTVLAIENDKYNPTLELAFKLARFCGQTIESIFSFREDEKK